MHSARLWFVCCPPFELDSPRCAFCCPTYIISPIYCSDNCLLMSLVSLWVRMRTRVCVNSSAWICAADNWVTQVCRSLSELPPRVHSARAHTFRHAYILREGPRSLDGCHYTAYHENVRMGRKAATVEQVDSGCLSDRARNSRLLTPPHISDTLLAEYCRANAKEDCENWPLCRQLNAAWEIKMALYITLFFVHNSIWKWGRGVYELIMVNCYAMVNYG